MPNLFLLDTNAYCLIFQKPKPDSFLNLKKKIQQSGILSFYISEITSTEIHSVLGKYRRPSTSQLITCERNIIDQSEEKICSNKWKHPVKKRMGIRVYRQMLKLISDIEAKRGNIQAGILKLDNSSLQRAKFFLMKYAGNYNVGSHDAVIAGSLIEAREAKGLELTLVTSDKGFKAALKDEGLPIFDPNHSIGKTKIK